MTVNRFSAVHIFKKVLLIFYEFIISKLPFLRINLSKSLVTKSQPNILNLIKKTSHLPCKTSKTDKSLFARFLCKFVINSPFSIGLSF